MQVRRRVDLPALARRMPSMRLVAPYEVQSCAADVLFWGDRLNRPGLSEQQLDRAARQLYLSAKNAAHYANMILNNFRPVRDVLAELDAPHDSGELRFKA